MVDTLHFTRKEIDTMTEIDYTITCSNDIVESNARLAQYIRASVPIKDDATDIETIAFIRTLLCKYNPIRVCKCYEFCSDCIYDTIKEKVGD